MVKPLFSNVTGEVAAILQLCRKFYHVIGVFQKVYLLVISRNSGLLSTGCDAIQNELLTNVLKGVLKILEKFQEELYNGDSV